MFEDVTSPLRTDWTLDEVSEIYDLPFMELVYKAQDTHRMYFHPNEVQISQLLSIKTGGCAENCGYCNQSAHFDTGLKASKLMPVEEVVAAAQQAKKNGAQRFCMGAAWRDLKDRDTHDICEMVTEVKALGLETCMTLGMLTAQQAEQLSEAGLDYYNHNIDTSPDYYDQVVTTRSFQDRLDTLGHVRDAKMKVCCGGILGMGEGPEDRKGMILALATLPEHPGSVPMNALVPIEGTPLGKSAQVDPLEFVRTVATARITMPQSVVRIAAGRETMSDEMQALCFLAGANSIFYGETLLTAGNPAQQKDQQLFDRLGLHPMSS
ncbi:MAG: biotin synthase BioB [Pseudomonadota bacterium]